MQAMMDAIRNNRTGTIHLVPSGRDYTYCTHVDLREKVRKKQWSVIVSNDRSDRAAAHATCKVCLRCASINSAYTLT